MKNPPKREKRKKKTAAPKGKRYRCTICRKRAPRKTTAPYYCPDHLDHKNDDSVEKEAVREARDSKKHVSRRRSR